MIMSVLVTYISVCIFMFWSTNIVCADRKYFLYQKGGFLLVGAVWWLVDLPA